MLIPPPFVFLFYVWFFLPSKAGTLVCNSLSVISCPVHYIWTFACPFVGCLTELLQKPFYYNWKLTILFVGCFKKFAVICFSSTTIGNFRQET